MRTKIFTALILNACIITPVTAGDIYRWTDPITGQLTTSPYLPPYPIKSTRTSGGLSNGNIINVILDDQSPEIKAIIVKQNAEHAEKVRIDEQKQKEREKKEEEVRRLAEERRRIAAQKAKEDAEYEAESDKRMKANNAAARKEAVSRLVAKDYEDTYKTTAIELFSDYEENEVNTDEKIKGKIIEISGTVQSIDKDFTDSIIIKIKTSNQFMPARLRVNDSQKQNAMKLNRGDEVTLRCQKVSRIMGSPSGRDCKF